MKKSYAIILGAILFFSTTLSAQTTKNWYLIGGNISNLAFDFQENNTGFSFNLTPRVAWFVQDNLAIGASILGGVSTSKSFSKTSTAIRYGIGPIARYYVTGRGVESIRKSRWFGDINIGFYGSNTKLTGTPATTTNGIGFGLGPGLAYFLNQNISLEALAKYNLTAGFGSSATAHNISLEIGFQIYLPRTKLKSMQKNDVINK